MVDPFPPNSSLAYTVSGSAALEKIVQRESLSGSKILVPAFICRYFLRPIFERYEIEPVFVDVDRNTCHIDFARAEPHIEDVDAVLLVHAFGLPAPTEQWVDRCREEDIVLIEDCARALWARYKGQPVGGFGDYAIFSLSKVSPVFTGGVLATVSTRTRVELTSPLINLDLLVKFLYNALPWDLPYKDRIRASYERLIGDRQYVTQETEQTLLNTDDDPSVRQLDPLNRWLFDQYLRRAFPKALGEQQSIATSLRTVLETYGFGVQPDAAGRVHYVLSATVPGDRDALVEYLTSRGHSVSVIWNEPWGLSAKQSRFEDHYPETRFLADNIVTFPVAEMTRVDAKQLIRDLRSYYEEREAMARPRRSDLVTEPHHD